MNKCASAISEEPRGWVAIWKWVQKFNFINHITIAKEYLFFQSMKTILQNDQQITWLLVAVMEPIDKQFLEVYIKTWENDSS